MRRCLLLLLIVCLPILLRGQVFLETIDGDELMLNPLGISGSTIIGNLNLSDQSVQFKTIIVLPNSKGVFPNKYFTLGLKGKPSNGVSNLFSGGKFNPNSSISATFTQINLFSGSSPGFIDFFSIKGEYNVNRMTIFDPDKQFKNQFENITFHGGGISLNYSNLIRGKHLLTLFTSYLFRNNYYNLETVEIREYKTITDHESETTREYGNTITGRRGNYKEYQSIPLRIAYTLTPSEDEEQKDKLKFGLTAYYTSEFGKFTPTHNMGAVLFLTKQNETSGVRIPIIGVGIQVNDITNNYSSKRKFIDKLSFNLTTAFNIASL